MNLELSNERLPMEYFRQTQQEVLQTWPTGKDVNFDEAVEYQLKLPVGKVFAKKLRKGREERVTFIQPRAGVALVPEHVELLKYLQDEGEADFLPTTIDSYTRQNRYKEAEAGICESRNCGRSMLNGFPAVNHGVEGCRRVVEAMGVPVQVRHGTPDARLLAEITLAGGFTDFEGGGISYNIPYSKDVTLEKTISDWQYVDRLVGLYEERGVQINREPFGPLTGTLVPPSISTAVAIIEALLAAEQGVKNLTVGYGQCGNLVQDVASIRALAELGEEYLKKYNYGDTFLTTVFHQWMGGFPQDESKAFGVISWGAVTAVLGGASKVIVKTPHEAMGIPTREANASGLKATKQIINMLKDQPIMSYCAIDDEMRLIKAEVQSIIDKTFELGEGDLAKGVVRAFQAGVIDIPFAPSRHNHGKIMPARDNHGAVRLLDMGNLPFTHEIREVHREKIAERGRSEGREPSFQMVIDDIYAIGKGMLVGRPR